jgi:hypothetical protein
MFLLKKDPTLESERGQPIAAALMRSPGRALWTLTNKSGYVHAHCIHLNLLKSIMRESQGSLGDWRINAPRGLRINAAAMGGHLFTDLYESPVAVLLATGRICLLCQLV